ncbi:MAG: hypothetical protein ABSD38_15610 [Syntrophorhabdales bacterium]
MSLEDWTIRLDNPRGGGFGSNQVSSLRSAPAAARIPTGKKTEQIKEA